MMQAFIFTTSLFLIMGLSTADAAGPRDELSGVKQEIRAKKQLISKTKKVEDVVSTELREIQRNLQQKENDLGRLNKDLGQVEGSLSRTGAEIKRVEEEARKKRAEIDSRLMALYKAGELGAVRMFFSAESFPQLAENIRYMGSVLDNDKKIFVEYNEKLEQLVKLKAELEKDARKKEKIKSSIQQKKLEIEKDKSNKAAYLGKVRQDRKSYEASLKELQLNASRLQSMITKLDEQSRRSYSSKQERPGARLKPLAELPPVPDRGFASQKGRMSFPAKGSVIESYGKHKHPEFNSFTFNKGLYIAASAGTDIKTIYDGTVIFSDYFKGFGNMMIIDHGGGYISLYAHASRLTKKVGAEVKKHDVLGAVGDVDSSKGSVLYFEIRQQGKPLDPAGWIR